MHVLEISAADDSVKYTLGSKTPGEGEHGQTCIYEINIAVYLEQ